MNLVKNPYRGRGLPESGGEPAVCPGTDAGRITRLLARCPAAAETPLTLYRALGERLGVGSLHLKDESGRMGLGSFKALGAANVIARDAEDAGITPPAVALGGRTYVAASAGNHGLSVAAGARVFGATAVIFLSDAVPEAFADRLRAEGARVERAGKTYEQSMAAASAAAARNGWTLLSDSSWPGYIDLPFAVMEGYLQMSAEMVAQMPEPPTHIFLQAGVGGMAAAVAAHVRLHWGAAPVIVVVEPEAAPALIEGVAAGRVVDTQGPVSAMGRLDCKTASLIALNGLARDADVFSTITEAEAARAVADLAAEGIATTPSGAAGVAALAAAQSEGGAALGPDSRVLAIVTEGAETA